MTAMVMSETLETAFPPMRMIVFLRSSLALVEKAEVCRTNSMRSSGGFGLLTLGPEDPPAEVEAVERSNSWMRRLPTLHLYFALKNLEKIKICNCK